MATGGYGGERTTSGGPPRGRSDGVPRGLPNLERPLRRRRGKARPDARFVTLHHEAGLLAHDLNNLLNVILAANEALAVTLAEGSGELELAEVSQDAAERSADLVRRLLALSEPRPDVEPDSDAAAAVLSVARLARLSAPDTVTIQCEVAEAGLRCRADRAGLEAALLNLCVNAIHAMPDGGVVVLSADAVGGDIVLRSRDSGCGMSPEVLARAGEPYFTTRKGRGGTGLGLAAVRAFAYRYGGRLDLVSKAGDGATVTLTLPRALA